MSAELGMALVHRLGWAAPRPSLVFVARRVTSSARRQAIAEPVTNPRHHRGQTGLAPLLLLE